MDYSITFMENSVMGILNQKNSWTNWKLIPDSPPMVPAPELDKQYIDIPGRRKGPIDVTGLGYAKTYKRITGSWNFLREIESKSDRLNLYNELRLFFTGNIMKIIIDEDPTHYYVGRISVAPPRAIINPMNIVLSYDLEPERYMVSDNSIDPTWIGTIIVNN